MGIGNHLLGDVEQLLSTRALQKRALFRMTGDESQCWRAEKEIEQMYPGTRCLLLPSATIAFSLILEILDLKPGKEVLISPFGWLSNWACIRRAGLVPRFLPLDADLQLRAEDVEARITERTGAVIVVHLMGRGQQAVGEIAALCAARGIPMLEDVAQSFGTSVGGRRTGTFGIAAWCSLGRQKVLSTGDGGFALTESDELYDRLGALHDHGLVIRNGKRRPATHPQPRSLSLRVPEQTAAVLRGQLARFNLMRTRTHAMHDAVAEACEARFGLEVLYPHEGDLPFTVLFRRKAEMRYPSLVESGGHVASNVPWLADEFERATREDPSLGCTLDTLAATSAVGSGFIDPFYSVPVGLHITDSVADLPRLIETLEREL